MADKNLVLDVEDNPSTKGQWFIFAFQHILAMLVACITVPLIMQGAGFDVPIGATLISAGVGTLIYVFFTKKKSPVFLSSSFAYLGSMLSGLALTLTDGSKSGNYLALILGMGLVGLVYVVVALVIKKVGAEWINKVLPPIVVGPVIMVIGLGLAGSAISNVTTASGSGASYNLIAILCALIALFATAAASHYGRGKMVSLIPFVVGMGAGYISAVLFTLIGFYGFKNDYFNIVNFAPLTSIFTDFSFASIINYKLFVPNDAESFVFLRLDSISKFDWTAIGTVVLLFVPVALVTICEHIGDHKNLGNIIGRDLLNDEPGMSRTLMGDGVATAVSGALCGAANTTYGENVAVIGTTRIASVNVVILAALMSIVVGFFTPFTALLSTIPACVTGGVSLVLYGFIASSGVKMLIQEKVDFNKSRNIFIASAILVSGIGGLALSFTVGGVGVTLTSTALSMILGILLNVCLKEYPEDVEEAE